jgi:steroid delta-isomerase-like uncharacterized protein
MNALKTPTSRIIPVLLLALGSLALSRAVLAEDMVAIVDSYIEAWNAHDAAKAVSFFTEDGEYYDSSVGTPQKGHEAVQKNVIQSFMTAAPDSVWTRKGDIIVGADAVAFEWTYKGTNTGVWGDGTAAANKPFDFSGATIIRFKEGKIQFQGDFYDAHTFYKQLGWVQ